MNLKILWGYVILISLVVNCKDAPRDAANSYQTAQQGKLQIGVVMNPPFSAYVGDSVYGSEVTFLQKFAEEKNLKISYVLDSESDLIEKLETFDLHIVCGGFEKKTSWKKRVTPTLPYDQIHVFLIPHGENRLLQELEQYIISKKL